MSAAPPCERLKRSPAQANAPSTIPDWRSRIGFPDRVRPRSALEQHEARGFANRQRLEREAVEDGKERGDAADAERQREHREGRHHWRGLERAPRVAPVDRQQASHGEIVQALGGAEAERVGRGGDPERRDGAGAAAPRGLEVLLPSVAHRGAEAQAHVARVEPQQRGEPARRRRVARAAHARLRFGAERSASTAATRAASRSRSRARTARPRGVIR